MTDSYTIRAARPDDLAALPIRVASQLEHLYNRAILIGWQAQKE